MLFDYEIENEVFGLAVYRTLLVTNKSVYTCGTSYTSLSIPINKFLDNKSIMYLHPHGDTKCYCGNSQSSKGKGFRIL